MSVHLYIACAFLRFYLPVAPNFWSILNGVCSTSFIPLPLRFAIKLMLYKSMTFSPS
jgi:hypothetical protein